ncbi:hypothetical protein ACFL5O_05505 [Myxococcota bacterium]
MGLMRTSISRALTMPLVAGLTLALTTCGGRGNGSAADQEKPSCGPTQNLCHADASADAAGPYCADLATDPANCGNCANACGPDATCSAGQCSTACQTNEKLCNAEADGDAGPYCADLATDPANCGNCANACGPDATCSAGQCSTACQANEKLCNAEADGDAGPYCADLATDPAHCGNCANACGPDATCSAGQCSTACQANEKLCNAEAGDDTGPYCADLATDPAHCGACAQLCQPGAVCSSGQCTVTTCPANQTLCNASGEADAEAAPYCANVQADKANCGCCGNACGSGQGCRNGRCDDTTSFGFYVFGDVHVGPTANNHLIQVAMSQMQLIDAEAIAAFSNGDLTDSATDAQWTQHDALVAVPGFQLDTTCPASFGAQKPYFATVGDAETTGASWYALWNQHLSAQQSLGQNGEDGIYYSLTYANALFVMLDSEHVSSAQTSWLESVLASAEAQNAQLKFLFFHQSVYACASRHPPLAAGLPWVDLAEQYHANVIFGSHTHVYTRTCPKKGGVCTADGTGVVFVETGPLGGQAREADVTTATIAGTDAAGNARSDTYNCLVGQDLMAAGGSQNDFCHVRVDGCQATVACYLVREGNTTPFDTWTVNGCG